MKRRDTLALTAAAGIGGLSLPLAAAGAPAAAPRVLRTAFPVAETGFDPAQVSDIYSRIITASIFEALYGYDHLARPAKIVPVIAEGMPEVADEWREYTIRIKPGIFFADDPAFKGQRRELVAQDYVYAILRFADPATKSPLFSSVQNWGLVGLDERRKQALDAKKPFDYDTPLEGLRALDRTTLRFKLKETRPRFVESLCVGDLWGAVAREVVEFYGDKIMEHPVGTGPFRLGAWRRSSRIVLERNPTYRKVVWQATPAAGDAEGQAIAKKLAGRPLPLLDRVEIDIIETAQPRWLAFLNGQHDLIERMPAEFIDLAMPGGKTAPHLAKRGIRGVRTLVSDITFLYFNMEDPVVGGLAPERVALRRAISLATDTGREIRTLRKNMAIPAQSPVAPNLTGYDPAFKSEMSTYDPARARALLDLYGWTDRNGDGWREQPDGKPLVLQIATQPDQSSRDLDELRQKNLQAVGIRVEFKPAKWPENLKAGRAGKLQVWALASLASAPDGQDIFGRYYGPQSGLQNIARFKLPELDRIYDQMSRLPDGPERLALFEQAKKLTVAYMPYKLGVHRYVADLMTDRVVGYRRPLFWLNWYHLVDVLPGGDSPA
ncbi:MAG: ABC transporter substrate-binding protein [Betaproteobacteria bacterium]